MSGALLAGLLAGWAVAVPVGAIGAHLVALSASAPWRTGVAAALGVATADLVYAAVAVVGGAVLAPAVERAAAPLRWTSAAVLLALAAHTAVGALRPVRAVAVPTPRGAFVRLLALTLVNPMTVLTFSALVVGLRERLDARRAAGLRRQRLRGVGELAAAAGRRGQGRGRRADRPARAAGDVAGLERRHRGARRRDRPAGVRSTGRRVTVGLRLDEPQEDWRP